MASTTRPTEEQWRMPNMLEWLKALQQAADREMKKGVFVYPNPITFNSQHQREGWIGYREGMEERHTIQKLEKVAKNECKTWVAFCDTPSEAYPGKAKTEEEKANKIPQWELVGQHAFGVAIVPAPTSGKSMYIFDCDQALPDEDELKRFSAKNLTTQSQRKFVEALKKPANVTRLFIGNNGAGNAGKDRCLSETTAWIERVAQEEDAKGGENAAFAGFVEIHV